jgi:hypothetical protein
MIEYQKRIDGRMAGKFFVAERDVKQLDQLLSSLDKGPAAHGNSKAVMVWGDVDDETLNHRIQKHKAKPITKAVFPSALAASRHLGYSYNAVGQALCDAKARGEDVATVGGVSFRWADDVPGLD